MSRGMLHDRQTEYVSPSRLLEAAFELKPVEKSKNCLNFGSRLPGLYGPIIFFRFPQTDSVFSSVACRKAWQEASIRMTSSPTWGHLFRWLLEVNWGFLVCKRGLWLRPTNCRTGGSDFYKKTRPRGVDHWVSLFEVSRLTFDHQAKTHKRLKNFACTKFGAVWVIDERAVNFLEDTHWQLAHSFQWDRLCCSVLFKFCDMCSLFSLKQLL